MVEEKKHPTEILVGDITRFTDDIESLNTALPLMMGVTGSIKKDTQEKFLTFLSEYGIPKEDAEEGTKEVTTYSFKIEHGTQAKKLKRQYDNFRNAYRLLPRHFVISLLTSA